MFPIPEEGDPLLAVIVTTSGGLVAGDRLEIAIRLAKNAAALAGLKATGFGCVPESEWPRWLQPPGRRYVLLARRAANARQA